jgi:uncharacterized protein YcbX
MRAMNGFDMHMVRPSYHKAFMIKVKRLFIYPVKSCKGIELNEFCLDSFGPKWDRRWMFINSEGSFISQRKFPKMATIETEILEQCLRLTLPTGEQASVSFSDCENAPTVNSTVWKDQVAAADCSEEISEMVSGFLGLAVRLVFMKQELPRVRRKTTEFQVGFADSTPLLLVNEASLEKLNDKLTQQIPMQRFRPNIVISGAEAFDELSWHEFRIGSMDIVHAEACERCVITTIDQSTGQRVNAEPLRTILSHFPGEDKKAYFGMRLVHKHHGSIKVGETLTNF